VPYRIDDGGLAAFVGFGWMLLSILLFPFSLAALLKTLSNYHSFSFYSYVYIPEMGVFCFKIR